MGLKKHIYIVFKTHFDIGFTDLAEEVIKRYSGKMLDDVISTCEGTKHLGEGKRYVWTMPSWPLSLSIKNTSEEKCSKALELLKGGQIIWHMLPFTTHTEFCGLEEYIRGFKFSESLSEEYGYRPISAKMTDVPGHTWILPALLKGAGVKFLHLGCNSGSMPPDVPMLFWWESPDGSRVLTFYSKGGYGSSLTPPEGWKYPAWLALIHTNDNAGPQSPGIIGSLEEEIKEALPDAVIHIGSMDDFYNHLIQYDLDIPVIRKDLSDSWIHGVGSYPMEVKLLRHSRRRLLDDEKLLSFLRIMGIDKTEDYYSTIGEAFENSLLFGEHTWGLDVKTTMGYDRHYDRKNFLKHKDDASYVRMEKSWDEQRTRAVKVSEYSLKIQDNLLKSLAQNICCTSPHVVVFNQLGYKRDAWVDIPYGHEFEDFLDARDSSAVSIADAGGCLKAYVRNIPALGYTTLVSSKVNSYVASAAVSSDGEYASAENDYYKLMVDKGDGRIISLYDKSLKKEWIDSSKEEGFGSYRYDIYGIEDITEYIRTYSYRFFDWLVNDLGRMNYPNCSHMTCHPSCEKVEVKADAYGSYINIKMNSSIESFSKYGDAESVSIKITLPHNENRINFDFSLSSKQETPFVEAGYFVFPINISSPMYAINKMGSVVNPASDIMEGANNVLYCLEDWVDISDGSQGICFVSHDIPLFSIGSPGILKYRLKYEEGPPVIYFNAFNNSWGTNFPQWMGGDYSFSFSLFSHKGSFREGNVPAKSAEILNVPITAISESAGHSLPISGSMFNVDGASVSAFKPADRDENAFILRLREINGKTGIVKISNCSFASGAVLCDLLEHSISDPIAFHDGSVSLKLKPFEIITVKMFLNKNRAAV